MNPAILPEMPSGQQPAPSARSATLLASSNPSLLIYSRHPLILISGFPEELVMLRKISAVLLGLLAAVATVMLM